MSQPIATTPTPSATIAADLSPQSYLQAAKFLSGLDGDWARQIAAIGPCLHQAKPAREPYEALVRAIAYQQLHTKAGDTILARFLALYPYTAFPSAQQLLASDPEIQRACGLSAAKLAAIRGIAQARLDGIVPTRDQALSLSDEALVERLVSLKGVGRWTVEMFLIYTLERSDILPVDDYGVRKGYRRLKGIEKAPRRARCGKSVGLGAPIERLQLGTCGASRHVDDEWNSVARNGVLAIEIGTKLTPIEENEMTP